MTITELRKLVARQRAGWSLEKPFYTSAEMYDFERSKWLAEQWYVLAHGSEVREPGSFITRELLGESLIIVRDAERVLRGFYNVCRHRGSRICTGDGRTGGFVCPYHAWSYRLDGTLRTAAALPQATDTAQLHLRAVPIREVGGVILGSLNGNSDMLDAVQRKLEPGLLYHGVAGARIAARRRYPTSANWKLVMENFFECYHCAPSHPEYCSVMKDDFGAQRSLDSAANMRVVKKWFQEEADPNSPLVFAENAQTEDLVILSAGRGPIGKGRVTLSQDGKPVAPLMGQQQRFDGGISTFSYLPFVYLFGLNDHAVMFQFLPTGPRNTDVVVTWLVEPSAAETEIDLERMIWLWDVTTRQDKEIIEQNAAGVSSESYAPGPYSLFETLTARFTNHYLSEIARSCGT